jgi:hypothetical protein
MTSFSEKKQRFDQMIMTRLLAGCTLATAMVLSITPPVSAEDNSKSPEQQSQTIANPLAKQSLRSLSATLQRPLFAPSRRPPPAEAAPIARVEEPAAPLPPPPQPTVVLVGTLIDAQGPQAILRSGNDNKDKRVRVGDDVSGWKIKDIDDRHLTLALDDRTFSVDLFPEKANLVQNTGMAQGHPIKRTALHEH